MISGVSLSPLDAIMSAAVTRSEEGEVETTRSLFPPDPQLFDAVRYVNRRLIHVNEYHIRISETDITHIVQEHYSTSLKFLILE